MPDTESSRRKSGVCFKRFAWHECSLRLYPTRLFQEIDYGFGLASRHFRISRAPLQPGLSDLFRSLSVDSAAFLICRFLTVSSCLLRTWTLFLSSRISRYHPRPVCWV